MVNNERKRKEDNKLKMRQKRADAKASQASTANESGMSPVPVKRTKRTDVSVSHEDQEQASTSTIQTYIMPATTAERKRKQRAKLTEESKRIIREKEAEVKRMARGEKSEPQRGDLTQLNSGARRGARMNLSDSHREDLTQLNSGARRGARSNLSEAHREELTTADTSSRNLARLVLPPVARMSNTAAVRMRNQELSEMGLLTPPMTDSTSIVVPSLLFDDNGYRIPFFQQTLGSCFCRTGLNNALGANVFTYESLGVECVDGENVEITQEAVVGNLESINIRCDHVNNSIDINNLLYTTDIGTWIMRNNNTQGHYIVLKRLGENQPLWLLDSAQRTPIHANGYFFTLNEQMRSQEQLNNLFMVLVRFPDEYVPIPIMSRAAVRSRPQIITAPSELIFQSYTTLNSIFNTLYSLKGITTTPIAVSQNRIVRRNLFSSSGNTAPISELTYCYRFIQKIITYQ